jgi:hypothetical protein
MCIKPSENVKMPLEMIVKMLIQLHKCWNTFGVGTNEKVLRTKLETVTVDRQTEATAFRWTMRLDEQYPSLGPRVRCPTVRFGLTMVAREASDHMVSLFIWLAPPTGA